MTEHSRTAYGYAFDFLGGINNDWLLWDLGGVYATGPNTGPVQALPSYSAWQCLLQEDVSPDNLDEHDPDVVQDLLLYEYDYSMYLKVPSAAATHVLTTDDHTPAEITRGVEVNGEAGMVVETNEPHVQFAEAITEEEFTDRISDAWVPVVRVAN